MLGRIYDGGTTYNIYIEVFTSLRDINFDHGGANQYPKRIVFLQIAATISSQISNSLTWREDYKGISSHPRTLYPIISHVWTFMEY
jgi:hypothetical protein